MATATVPATEETSEREQRHCPECGNIYGCSPRWRHAICPACNGHRIAQSRAQRREEVPAGLLELPDAAPTPTDLGRELAAMQGLAILLDALDDVARPRVMAWLTARYREGGAARW